MLLTLRNILIVPDVAFDSSMSRKQQQRYPTVRLFQYVQLEEAAQNPADATKTSKKKLVLNMFPCLVSIAPSEVSASTESVDNWPETYYSICKTPAMITANAASMIN